MILKNLIRVSVRESRIIFTHPVYWMCMIVAPIIVTLFFTSLMNEGLPHEMPVGVVDLDNTTTTRKLIRTLDSFQTSKVVAHYPTVDEARHAVQRGEIYAFMYFPKSTTDQLLSARQPKISFYYSNTSLMAGSLLFKDMKTMCMLGSAAVGQSTMQAKGFTPGQIMAFLQPIVIDVHNVGNPWVSYNIYLSAMVVPGCILLFVFLITAFSLGAELKFGANKELMDLAGDDLIVAVLGKFIPHTCLFVASMFGALTYMFGILHFPAPGGMPMLYLLGFLSVVGSQGFALFIFSLLPSMRLSMSICSLWSVLSFSMVGSAYPVFAMDKPLEMLSWFFPLRHYYVIYQLCVFNPFPLTDAIWHVVALLVFTFIPWIFYKRLGFALRNYVYVP